MPKVLKWILGILVVCGVMVITAMLLAPVFFNLEKMKPRIEAEAAKVIGRPLTLGGKIEPSVFPWVGISLADVHLGNPEGFSQKDFVALGLFEVRVKLLPLLSGQVVIKRFVVKEPRIVLETTKAGRSNLEGLGSPKADQPPASPAPFPPDLKTGDGGGLPIKSLKAEEFAVVGGHVLMIDQAAGTRQVIDAINLTLTNLSLDQPVGLHMGARIDGKSVALNGSIGPVGPEPGKSPVPLDLTAELIQQIVLKIKGRVDHLQTAPTFDMHIDLTPFSPRAVLARLEQPMPLTPADPQALSRVALSANLAGSPEKITLSNGRLSLDDAELTFQAQVQSFDKPDLKLSADLDHIDLDRYLPAPAEEKAPRDAGSTPPSPAPEAKPDYTPLRKLLLEAQIKVGKVKAKNVRMQNVLLKATAKNGIIRLDPLQIDLYQGRMATSATVNVQKDSPRTVVGLNIDAIQAAPLIKDFLEKKLIEGAVSAGIDLNFSGDQPDAIQKTLNGKGEIKFNDGAIVGIDLVNMVRNVQSAFGLGEKPTRKPRTDFSELLVPFSVNNGVVDLNNASLASPLLRFQAGGRANLVDQTLDLRVEPKFVATLTGQGDATQRSGLMVPVLISGSFTDPKFKPDLKSILKQQLPDKETLKKMVPPKESIQKDLEKKAQELFKGLPFGQ